MEAMVRGNYTGGHQGNLSFITIMHLNANKKELELLPVMQHARLAHDTQLKQVVLCVYKHVHDKFWKRAEMFSRYLLLKLSIFVTCTMYIPRVCGNIFIPCSCST